MDALTKKLIGIALCIVLLIPVFVQREEELQQAVAEGEVITGMTFDTVLELWVKPDRVYKNAKEAPPCYGRWWLCEDYGLREYTKGYPEYKTCIAVFIGTGTQSFISKVILEEDCC
jgi:hypothetical protein